MKKKHTDDAGHRDYDKDVEVFGELLAQYYIDATEETEEALEKYIESVHIQIYSHVNKFAHRFAMGYAALVEELDKVNNV